MSYVYADLRPKIFTEEGVAMLIATRDEAQRLLHKSGAVRADMIMTTCDSWLMLACIDYLVEVHDLLEVTRKDQVHAQNRVFVAGRGLP